MARSLVVFAAIALAGCSQPQNPAPEAPASSAVHVEPAASAPPPASATAPAAPPATASAAPAPAASSAAAPVASAPAEPEAPLPKVKVANIGMHIGGGPNDDATKEPIKKSVEPHFDAFRRCWAILEDPAAKGDFGLDLHIDKDGGRAKVDHPRTALKGKPFTACVVKVFEGIDFRKPKTGNTTVSYSLRFTPLGAEASRPADVGPMDNREALRGPEPVPRGWSVSSSRVGSPSS